MAPDVFGHQDHDYYYGQMPAAASIDPYAVRTHDPRQATPPAPPPAQPNYPPSYEVQPSQAGYAGGYRTAGTGQPNQYAPQPDAWGNAPAGGDPRSFDLSSYMPPRTRTSPPQDSPRFNSMGSIPGYGQAGVQPDPSLDPHYGDWGHQPDYGQGGQSADAYTGSERYSDAYQGGYQAGQQAAHDGEYDYENEESEFAEPPRRGRYMMMASAFAGAVVVGGGLWLAYQAVLGPTADKPTPVVGAPQGPAKVKPDKVDGKQFAHSDSKVLGRLNDGGSSAGSDSSGTRKVATLVVGRDGSIQAPAPAAVSVPVPGMTIVDIGGSDPAPAQSQPPPPAQAPIAIMPPAAKSDANPAAKPVEIARVEPPKEPLTTQAVEPSTINAPVQKAAPPPAKPKPVETAATAPPDRAPQAPRESVARPAASAPTPAPTGAGYVAVLASLPASGTSRLDALQQFADLQQKYGGVLLSKTPDVQEANIPDKGRFHRLLAGPPGSKDAANTVCAELKSAGHTNCWVMAY